LGIFEKFLKIVNDNLPNIRQMTQTEDTNTSNTQSDAPNDAGLRLLWSNFNTWDKTANKRNAVLRRWRKLVLIFIIAGAFCGVLSSNLASLEQQYFTYAAQGLAFLSTLFIALASYAGSEILTDKLVKAQINSRAAAESFKSEAYRYIFKAPPYDQNPEQKVFERAHALQKVTRDITYETLDKEDELKGIPDEDMTIYQYIQMRIEDQIYKYFTPKIKTLQKKHKRGKNFTLGFGFAGVILGAISSTGLGFTQHTASWIAFITSASAAVTSFMATNRYYYLISSYQTTSNRLKTLLTQWQQTGEKTPQATSHFVADVENELMRENQSWVEELSKKLDEKKDLGKVARNQAD